MTSIRAVGVQGGNALRERLATAKDPKIEIRSFVSENSLQTPSCLPAHELLDLMGFTRAAQHECILKHMKKRLLNRIDSISADKQLALLEKCFPYISIPELREIPLALFSHMPRIPSSYLKPLAQSQELFADLPASVQRQVWALDANEQVFHAHVKTIISKYQKSPKALGTSTGLMNVNPNQRSFRKQSKSLQLFVADIGDSSNLYGKAVAVITSIYDASPEASHHLCSLRLQLPLAIHESGGRYSAESDSAFRLAFCLSNAVKEKDVPASLSTAEGLIENVTPLDLGMLLRTPEVQGFLSHAILSACARVAEEEGIPKDDKVLQVSSKLLCLSMNESLHHYTSSKLPNPARRPERQTEDDKACLALLEEFYPALTCSLVDDMIREGSGEPEPLESSFTSLVDSSAPGKRLLLQYILECLPAEAADPEKVKAGSAKMADAEKAKQLLDAYSPSEVKLHVREESRCLTIISRRISAILPRVADSERLTYLQEVAKALLLKTTPLCPGRPGILVSSLQLVDALLSSYEDEDNRKSVVEQLQPQVEEICAAAKTVETEILETCLSLAFGNSKLETLARLERTVPDCKEVMSKSTSDITSILIPDASRRKKVRVGLFLLSCHRLQLNDEQVLDKVFDSETSATETVEVAGAQEAEVDDPMEAA